MESFKSSGTLKGYQASTTKSVTFATSASTESIPSEERWWSSKFHLGPLSIVKSVPNYKKSTSSTSVTFHTPAAGSSIISHAIFAPNAIKGHPYQMAVSSGPRVCLYGGTQVCSLAQALARPSNKKLTTEEQISLFGEEGEKQDSPDVKPDRSISTGGFPAHHASYHPDGRLLVVGCDDGNIKVCDSTSRATLRTFSAFDRGGGSKTKGYPVRSVGWIPEVIRGGDKGKKLIWSAGDDAILRVWDLSGAGGSTGIGDGEKPIAVMRGHGDAIRCCTVVAPNNSGLGEDSGRMLLTGSYDHTIRAWDMHGLGEGHNTHNQPNRCSSIMDHGAPVECLIVVQSHQSKSAVPIVISAGGTTIKLWNPIIGTCLSTLQTKHSKTITSLCLASIIREDISVDEGKVICKRLLSAGLDGLIRIYSLDELHRNFSLPYVHGAKTPHPITALAMSPDYTKLVVGTSVGLVTVRQRAKYVPQGIKRKQTRNPRAGTFLHFMRGADAKADANDHIVHLLKKKKLRKYDVSLKKFQYSEALDEVLKSRDSRAIIAVLEELGRRRGLRQALSNRDEETLEPILAFTASNIQVPKHTPVLVGVANYLCDIYSDVFGQSETVDEQFEKLRMHVRNEVRSQERLLQLVGQIDAVMYQATQQE